MEAFNGRAREELFNAHLFEDLPHAQAEIQAWRDFYNHHRPHSALGYRSPVEFAEALRLGKVRPEEDHPESLLQTL